MPDDGKNYERNISMWAGIIGALMPVAVKIVLAWIEGKAISEQEKVRLKRQFLDELDNITKRLGRAAKLRNSIKRQRERLDELEKNLPDELPATGDSLSQDP